MQTHSDEHVRGVDVAGLERQLAETWSKNAREGQTGLTRVCVVNLIIFVPNLAERGELDELLEEVAAQTPGRIIVILVDCDSPSRLDAYVSTRCGVALKGRTQVCGEQVTIEAGGAACQTAASAVEPLLVPDIPAFLWWKDIPHDEDKLFARLVEMSDRVVIDSAAFDHTHADLRRVARLVESRADVLRLSDLNWGRLTTWRNLIANFWDVPAYRAHLDTLDTTIIDYVPSSLAPEEIAAQSLLVAGWLASCLGWETRTRATRATEGHQASFTSGSRTIDLQLRAVEGECEGAIKRVEFRSAGGAAEFFVSADESGARIETSAKIGDTLEVGRVLAREARTEGQRLSRELGILARDEVYERAVRAAVGLIAPDDESV
jgi:glucose-6-phosphate dehydrogenase assembly protein OpcA